MKPLRRSAQILILLAAPLTALAHPGHDDPDFNWDFEHLVEHPFATLLCFAVIATGAWVAWRLARRSSGASAKDSRHRTR